MPIVNENTFEFEEKNDGHSSEVSCIYLHPRRPGYHPLYGGCCMALCGPVGVAVVTGLDATHPEDPKFL